MVNELEIRAYLRRNDFEALGRVADWLAFDRHMTIADVFDLFERLGGDRQLLEREFRGGYRETNRQGGHDGRHV